MYQKSMFDRYYCIKTLFSSKTLEKLLQKGLFYCTYDGTENHVTCERFENTASRAKTNASPLCMLLMMMMSVVMKAPECLFVKSQSSVLTAHELAC